MMTNIFLSFFEISISSSPVILLFLLLTPLFNKRYAAKWRYWIWIFIALRLIIPYNGWGSAADAWSQRKTQSVEENRKDYADPSNEQTIAPRRVMITVPAQMTDPIVMQSEKSSSNITILDIVAYVWMSGSLVFLFFHLISYFCYRRQVIKTGTPVKNSRILRQMSELKSELQIKATVRVIIYPEASSPMMTGFLRPVLVLPDEQYCSEELFFILKHELVHLKRRDVYVKLLFVMANAAHWFNPLVWIMQKEAGIDMELSCDERVTQGTDYATRKAYTETLLSTLHKQCTKRNPLSTQFYGGKQIMKKRFKNILRKTRKKNGAAILIIAVVLTISLGTLVGCSVGKENTPKQTENMEDIPEQTESVGDTPEQTKNSTQPEETDFAISDENGTEAESSSKEIPVTDDSGGEALAENTRILTIMKEGEKEEKQATLVTDQLIYDEFLFYLPDGEWQKEEAAKWQAVENENVHLWVAHFDKDYQIERILADDGYRQEDGVLTRQEEGIQYKVRLQEEGDSVWCIFYCYPVEAEEGWGSELPVIADTFAVIAPAEIFHGYISAFDNGTVTIDRQIWATAESEYWKPEYNEDAGFEVVDAEGEDITYPLHEDCTFFILENHYDSAIELDRDAFADYLTEMEYPVLWIFELEDGQIKNIMEQYIP